MTLIHGLDFRHIRGDIFGGITAAVVALPLALAFGVASGAGAIAGLYGAIFVGLFAALFGGTPAQVSGPTGPMTVVMAVVVTQYGGNPAMAFTVVMLGGAFQILFGVFRIGRFIELVPFSVVSGFMSGIGVIIILLQIGPLLGHPAPSGTLDAISKYPAILSMPGRDATIAATIALAIVFLTPKAISRWVPSSLLALVVGTLVVLFAFPGAPVLGAIPTGLPAPIVPQFTVEALPDMVRSGLILAALGSIDSLLTSLIHDSATRTYHKPNRELIGQGIGNMVAGLFGGIPGAGATMRTMINVRSGGRTPVSGALHALVLLALVLGLAPLASYIPHAVLAGILIKVGVDIIDWGFLKRMHRVPRAAVVKMFVVLLLTVFVDLILAVGVGIVMASLIYVKSMADYQAANLKVARAPEDATLSDAEAELLASTGGQVLLLQPDGPVSFAGAGTMGRRVGEAGNFDVLVLDLSAVPMLDNSAALALEEIIRQAREAGRPAFLTGLHPKVEALLQRMGTLDLVHTDHRFPDRMTALDRAAKIVLEVQRTGPLTAAG
ncbi:MAG: SulP family inorganic anion transporter [Bauldia litoralis]